MINCIGLAPWLTPAELRGLLRRFAAHLHPAGCVLVDRWNRSVHAEWAEDAEIHVNYHTHEEYRDHAEACGFALLKCEVLGGNEGMAYVLQRGSDPRGRSRCG